MLKENHQSEIILIIWLSLFSRKKTKRRNFCGWAFYAHVSSALLLWHNKSDENHHVCMLCILFNVTLHFQNVKLFSWICYYPRVCTLIYLGVYITVMSKGWTENCSTFMLHYQKCIGLNLFFMGFFCTKTFSVSVPLEFKWPIFDWIFK